MNEQTNMPDERPFGVIVTDLWEKTEALVRQEMRLGITEAEEKVDVLKAELKHDVDELKVELAARAIGGGVALAGLFALVAALILGLAHIMPDWVAAVIVAVVLGGAGALLLNKPVRASSAVKRGVQSGQLVPERTVESLRTDARTINEATK